MFKRTLWIPSHPILSEDPNFVGDGMGDSLAATPEIYAAFAAMPFLSLEEVAFLILGCRPYEWEDNDVGTDLKGYSRLLSCLLQSACCGAIEPSPTLSQAVAWAKSVGLQIPSLMAEAISCNPTPKTDPPTSAQLNASALSRKPTDHDPVLQTEADAIVREHRARGDAVPNKPEIAKQIKQRLKVRVSVPSITRRIRCTR